MSKEQSLNAFAEAHDDLIIAADAAVTRGDPHAGGWGLREILAHISAWEAEGIRRIPLLAAGADDEPYDVGEFNAAVAASLGDRPLHEIRDDLERTHARLITLLDGLDELAFSPDGAAGEWITELIRHSREHAAELGADHKHAQPAP